jgi:hypothetical protein
MRLVLTEKAPETKEGATLQREIIIDKIEFSVVEREDEEEEEALPKKRKRRNDKPIDGFEVIKLHKEGYDRYELAEYFNVSINKMLSVMKRAGIPTSTRESKRENARKLFTEMVNSGEYTTMQVSERFDITLSTYHNWINYFNIKKD